MKKRLVRASLAMMVSISVIGCNTIKTADGTAETDNYIDMNTVVSYSGTANCKQPLSAASRAAFPGQSGPY